MAAPFKEPEWSVLLSLADTLIPELTGDEIGLVRKNLTNTVGQTAWENIEPFLGQSCRDSKEFIAFLNLALGGMPESARERILKVLSSLGTPFTELPRLDREKTIRSWLDGTNESKLKFISSLKTLLISGYLRTSPVALTAIGYPGTDPRIKEMAPQPFFKFDFESYPETLSPIEIQADVVVVGSGSGGGVVASKIASEFPSRKVIILEKGKWFPQDQLPLREVASLQLYQAARTPDEAFSVVAGSTWGGGSTVNYSASIQTPISVRREWAEDFGLDFTESSEFQECLDRVCRRMGVSSAYVRHSSTNQALIDGSRLLGINTKDVPQNTGGKEHPCGFCGYGCPTGDKHGGPVTWLVDAQKAGARCIKECKVTKVLFDGKKAIGVSATVSGKIELVIKAPIVVMSAGAINTPCILENSGVENPNIGKNLRIHPIVFTWAFFNQKIMNPWEGSILTTTVAEHENMDGKGYGSKLINGPLHPGFNGHYLPWESATQWRSDILRFNNSACAASIARDRDSSGTISPIPGTVDPYFTYNLSEFDASSMMEGVVASCKIYVAAGADEIQPVIEGAERYRVDKVNPLDGGGICDPRFKEFIRTLRAMRINKGASAHQMGTCRMGKSGADSVTDTRGKVWGYDGLYVADTSLFPTASGVNPMITCMALADWVGTGLVEEMKV